MEFLLALIGTRKLGFGDLSRKAAIGTDRRDDFDRTRFCDPMPALRGVALVEDPPAVHRAGGQGEPR
jgi:hypothetical protein